jgi:hypothetical protein
MIRRIGRASFLVLALLAALAPFAVAKKGGSKDIISAAPDYAAYGVKSIALLPIATYDHDLAAERMVGELWGVSFKGYAYRWISAMTARDMLRGLLGDSTLQAVREQVLKAGRVDSLRAPLLCAKLRVDAVLSVRVDQWEQRAIQWNQSGRSMTSVRLRAALVDSTGALLWGASGAEDAEGAYHTPDSTPVGVSATSLESRPLTGEGGPPAFDLVLTPLLARWAPQFPPPPAAAPPAK